MTHQAVSKLWLEPGGLGWHHLTGVCHGDQCINARRVQRYGQRHFTAVDTSLEFFQAADTANEVDAFVNDADADAYEKLVDRYLASPHYGERWGRHWLDVARYADTKGYAFARDRRYPFAYTYRDYVIRAWNDDLPFDQFVVQQLACDLDLSLAGRDIGYRPGITEDIKGDILFDGFPACSAV